MNFKALSISLALGIAATGPATAQNDDTAQPLDVDDATAALRYALPHVMGGVRNACGPHLENDGFLAVNGERLQTLYTEGADENWLVAREVLLEMAAQDKDASDGTELLAALPEDALQPFVDGLLPTLVAREVKPKDCIVIEDFIETLDPLPPENLARTLGLILSLALADREQKAAKASEAAAE